jgi:hypothetical protein
MQSESHDLAQPAELSLPQSQHHRPPPPLLRRQSNGIDLSAIRVAECIFSTTALRLTDGPTDGLHFALWHAPRVALTHLELTLCSFWASIVVVCCYDGMTFLA